MTRFLTLLHCYVWLGPVAENVDHVWRVGESEPGDVFSLRLLTFSANGDGIRSPDDLNTTAASLIGSVKDLSG